MHAYLRLARQLRPHTHLQVKYCGSGKVVPSKISEKIVQKHLSGTTTEYIISTHDGDKLKNSVPYSTQTFFLDECLKKILCSIYIYGYSKKW